MEGLNNQLPLSRVDPPPIEEEEIESDEAPPKDEEESFKLNDTAVKSSKKRKYPEFLAQNQVQEQLVSSKKLKIEEPGNKYPEFLRTGPQQE